MDENFTKQEDDADAKCKKQWHVPENMIALNKHSSLSLSLHLKSWKDSIFVVITENGDGPEFSERFKDFEGV